MPIAGILNGALSCRLTAHTLGSSSAKTRFALLPEGMFWRIMRYRRTVDPDSSAELCAASASFAEIAAVSAGVPQLGASLPSPQARGR
jgi:hypothetical protein